MSFYSKLYFSPCLFSIHQVFCSFFDWAITLNHTKLESHRWWPINLSMFFWLVFVLIYTFNVTFLFFIIWIVFLRTLLFPFFSFTAGIRFFWNFFMLFFHLWFFIFVFFWLAAHSNVHCKLSTTKIYGIGPELVFFAWKRQNTEKNFRFFKAQ